MAFPLIPLLIGAGIGGFSDEDNPLRGALLGGTLGALTGGLGGAAEGAGAAAVDTVGAEAGIAGSLAAAPVAGESGIAASLAKPSQGLLAMPSPTSGVAASVADPTFVSGIEASLAGPTSTAGAPAAPSMWSRLSSPQKGDALAGQAILGSQEQQQPAPVAQPLQQREFVPAPSVQEKLARVGGNEPLFTPLGVFQEVKDQFEDEELMRELRERGLV